MNLKELLAKMLCDTMVKIVFNDEISDIVTSEEMYLDERSRMFEVKRFNVVNNVVIIYVK